MESIGIYAGIEETEEKEAETEEKSTMPQLFDFIRSVMETKQELMRDQILPLETMEKAYPAYAVNKGISMGSDTILVANEMNRLWALPNDAQYRYYMHSIRKGKRRNPWAKKEKLEDLNLVARHFLCNKMVARQMLKMLTQDDLNAIKEKYDEGGVKKKNRKKKKE